MSSNPHFQSRRPTNMIFEINGSATKRSLKKTTRQTKAFQSSFLALKSGFCSGFHQDHTSSNVFSPTNLLKIHLRPHLSYAASPRLRTRSSAVLLHCIYICWISTKQSYQPISFIRWRYLSEKWKPKRCPLNCTVHIRPKIDAYKLPSGTCAANTLKLNPNKFEFLWSATAWRQRRFGSTPIDLMKPRKNLFQ